jgi:hypothetical protein
MRRICAPFHLLLLAALLLLTTSALAQDQQFEGFIDDENEEALIEAELEAGITVLITAEATSGDLDTTLTLLDPEGFVVAANDDASEETYNSALAYTVETGGLHTIIVGRYEGGRSSGDFVVTITVGDESLLAEFGEVSTEQITLSGETQIIETDNFRIHYTLEGADATTEEFAQIAAEYLEETLAAQLEMGWALPPSEDLLLVYLSNSLAETEESEGVLGFATTLEPAVDNPNTEIIEERARAGILVIDNDFEGAENALALLRATAAHEFNHVVQFGYDSEEPMSWYLEATATWMETVVAPEDQDAVGYEIESFESPELCLATTASTVGKGYADWMFMQVLEDIYGEGTVIALWDNIVALDSFDALDATLAAYDSNTVQAVALYRLQNLARDYELGDLFESTVFLHGSIESVGDGIASSVEELGANYIELALEPGLLDVGLDNEALELFALGVYDGGVDVAYLGTGSTIDTTGYDYVYLMVFNPAYDNDTSDCVATEYSVFVSEGTGEPVAFDYISYDSRFFIPLGVEQ